MAEWQKHAPSRQFCCLDTISMLAPLMSIYTLSGAAHAIEQLKLPNDHYVLNVTYRLAEGKKNCTGDTQLFVTGTVAKRELPEEACLREVQEEIMMQMKDMPRHLSKSVFGRGGKVHDIDWYSFPISELEPLNLSTEGATGKDGKSKVGCILHGTYEEVLDLYARLPVADEAADGIVGIVALRIEDVKAILKLIPKFYERRDHFFWRYNWGTSSCPRQPKDIYAFSGRYIPWGAADPIRSFAESGSWNYRTHHRVTEFCTELECVAFARPDSIYCSKCIITER